MTAMIPSPSSVAVHPYPYHHIIIIIGGGGGIIRQQ
jgi:hypothetical protein